MKGKPQNKLL